MINTDLLNFKCRAGRKEMNIFQAHIHVSTSSKKMTAIIYPPATYHTSEGTKFLQCSVLLHCWQYTILMLFWYESSQWVFRVQHSCPAELVFSPYFTNVMVKVKALGPPHVIKLWLGVNEDMLPIKYACSKKASLCFSRISWRS